MGAERGCDRENLRLKHKRICDISTNDLTIRAEADIIEVLGRFCKPTGEKPVNSAAVSVVKWI